MLSVIKELNTIGKSNVVHFENGNHTWNYTDGSICVDHQNNTITFKLQNGPIKEVGVNGCQIDDMLSTVKEIVWGHQKLFPCEENTMVCAKIDSALEWLWNRRHNREKRGVEGTSKL